MPYKAHARNAKARAAPQLKAGNLSKDETERIDRKADRKHDDSAAIQSLHPQHTERADRGNTGCPRASLGPRGVVWWRVSALARHFGLCAPLREQFIEDLAGELGLAGGPFGQHDQGLP